MTKDEVDCKRFQFEIETKSDWIAPAKAKELNDGTHRIIKCMNELKDMKAQADIVGSREFLDDGKFTIVLNEACDANSNFRKFMKDMRKCLNI